MKKHTFFLLLLALFLPGFSYARVSASQEKHLQLVDLFRTADRQRDLMHEILNSNDGNLEHLSIHEIKKTVDRLDDVKEGLIAARDAAAQHGTAWSKQDSEHLLLAQELIRQLTNARREYEQRVKSSDTFRKTAIPIGAGLGVAALMKIADTLFNLQLDSTTVLVCGLATSGVVGAVTLKEEINDGLGVIRDTVSHAWNNESWEDTATVVAACAGAAATGTILWKSYDSFQNSRPTQQTLEEFAGITAGR